MRQNISLSDLNVEIQGKGNSYKKHILSKIGIGVTEFLLSSVLYCYGIIFYEYAITDCSRYKEGVFAAIMFRFSWSITDPIARFITETLDDRKGILFRCLLVIGVFILFICIIIPNSMMLYTVSAGIVSNILSNQLSYFAVDKLDMDMRIYEIVRQIAHALSLLFMPHFIFFLIDKNQIFHVKMIYGSVLFHIIPAGLLIKLCNNVQSTKYPEITRYQTIGRHSYQLNEIKAYANEQERQSTASSTSSNDESLFDQPNYFQNQHDTNEVALKHNEIQEQGQYTNTLAIQVEDQEPKRSNPSQYYQSYENDIEEPLCEAPDPSLLLTPVSSRFYFQRGGVSILPGIPEENEDDNDDINYIDPKRLSMISTKLEELNIQDQIRRESIKEVFTIDEVISEPKPEPINYIEYISNYKSNYRTSIMDELKKIDTSKYCFQCSPYKKYIWARRLRIIKDFIKDNFIRPLYYSLKSIYFYPCLTTKTVGNLVSVLYITLAPFMVMQENLDSEEGTFLLSYVAFGWAFFLLGLPLVVKLNQTKMRIMFTLGLVVSGSSCLLLSLKLTDAVIISSLLFGFGYGLINYSERIVYRSSVGMRPWYFIQGPLETLSAIFILIIYYVIYTHMLDLKLLLLLAAISYFINAFLWLCLPFMKYLINLLKRLVFDERSQHEEFFQ